VLWTAATGKGFSSLAVSGGRVFTLVQEREHEAAICWDAEQGTELWRFRYPCRLRLDHGDGPRSTPAVEGDRIYLIGAGGIFHCLDTADGRVRWRHDLDAEFGGAAVPRGPAYWGHCCSPLVEGVLVVTSTGGPNRAVAAFNKHTGRLVWKALDDPAGYSSPIAATLAGTRQFVFFTGVGLVGLSPADGSLLWRFPWETNDYCNIVTPIAAGNYLFISTGYDGGCALVEIAAGDDGSWRAEQVYAHKRMRNHFSTCVLCRGYLYGFDNTHLVCMDFRTGRIHWKQRGFQKGSLLIADGRLIVLGEDGLLAMADAAPDAYRQRGCLRFSQNRCWTVPVLAGGRLYVRDEERLVCFDLKKSD
jgi:outer membrane protein assembly factor BamB